METLRKKIAKEEKLKKLKDNLFGLGFLLIFLVLIAGMLLIAFFELSIGWWFIGASVIMMLGIYILGLLLEKGGT